MEAQEDGFPVDVEEKEAYFMSEVARGEQLAQEGMFWYFPLSEEEDENECEEEGIMEHNANMIGRI